MASLGLAPDELKQLDLMRNRFQQLASSLASLRGNVFATQPLPNRESLQASASILLKSVNTIQDIVNDNAELFQRVAVHPSTNYPGRTQEHILLHLLRKKLEPDIEGMVEEARQTARTAGVDASKLASGKLGGGDDEDGYGVDPETEEPTDPFNEQWVDLWQACYDDLREFIENQSGEAYTVAEREAGVENVRTGLRRNLEEDSDEDEEEDEEEKVEEITGMKGSQGHGVPLGAGAAVKASLLKFAGIQPEHVLWFAARGDLNLPPSVEFERTRKPKDPRKIAAQKQVRG